MDIAERECTHSWRFLSATGSGSRQVMGKLPPRDVQVVCRICALSARMQLGYKDVARAVFDSCPRCQLSRGRPGLTYSWSKASGVSCSACEKDHEASDVTLVVHGDDGCFLEIECHAGDEPAHGYQLLAAAAVSEATV